MALRMVALIRAKDGSWFARKVIPADVRDPYARLFGFAAWRTKRSIMRRWSLLTMRRSF